MLPDVVLSFEDARREFLQVYALEMQRLGISDTDRTVTEAVIETDARDEQIKGVERLPAFAEFHPSTAPNENYREKVEIVPLEMIAEYEGSRAIAFYGHPLRYRAAWDFWKHGTLYLFYDPVPIIESVAGADDISFPRAFYTYLVKKAALNLVPVARLKLAFLAPEEQKEMLPVILPVLASLEASLAMQAAEWARQFELYRNKDGNETARLRRTNDELQFSNYKNTTGRNPLDFTF